MVSVWDLSTRPEYLLHTQPNHWASLAQVAMTQCTQAQLHKIRHLRRLLPALSVHEPSSLCLPLALILTDD
ncbi:unnamed protein product [Protopolystoma xenopodis]|uniref:Uncharacterized protein n=1 Tax=Protopolystoma xenopodis TaxID=117903 RepID=A0A3S5BPW1_9PLAT|nr:unnamed protein product [Protopolystoma xenopodis]